MNDRHEQLMIGLYRGVAPSWLPPSTRPHYLRESLRRRCDLGQVLTSAFRCSVYCAQWLVSPDIAQRVYEAWPSTWETASNVKTGLYLAFAEVLRATDGADVVTELLDFEALAASDLRCDPRADRVEQPAVAEAGLGETEVYRFRYAIAELHARAGLYAGAAAPAAFIRELAVTERPTFFARRPTADRKWTVEEVTAAFASQGMSRMLA